MTADTVNDFWVAQPQCDIGSVVDQGRVVLLSGVATRTDTTTVLRTIDSPEPQTGSKFGFFISVPGDINGDGTNDIAIGTDSQDVQNDGTSCTAGNAGCNTDQGKAWVFSGATGTKLYDLNNPVPQGAARFGSRIGRAGDIVAANGTAGTDGKPEIIVGASNNDVGTIPNQGQAFIFNGADGTLVRTLNLPAADVMTGCGGTSSCGTFGLAVQGPGDINGDGYPDQLVDAGSLTVGGNSGQGRMYLFSGFDGSLIRSIDDPTPQASATFGFQDVTPLAPGDLNPAGSPARPDVYGNGFLQDATYTGQGKAWVFDGSSSTNALLRTLDDPTPELGGQFGWSMDKTDFNSGTDTTNDLYVGQSPHHVTGGTGYGGTYVLNGTSGAELKRLEMPANTSCQQTDARLGWTVSAPGDLNGDGQPDYVAGAPFFDRTSNTDEGVLLVFMSGETPNSRKTC